MVTKAFSMDQFSSFSQVVDHGVNHVCTNLKGTRAHSLGQPFGKRDTLRNSRYRPHQPHLRLPHRPLAAAYLVKGCTTRGELPDISLSCPLFFLQCRVCGPRWVLCVGGLDKIRDEQRQRPLRLRSRSGSLRLIDYCRLLGLKFWTGTFLSSCSNLRTSRATVVSTIIPLC